MTQIKDVPVGTEVAIYGIVLRQSPGQTLLWNQEVGESGQWSIVNSVDCEMAGEPSELLQEFIRRQVS